MKKMIIDITSSLVRTKKRKEILSKKFYEFTKFTKHRFNDFIIVRFNNKKWARKYIGGYWEKWYIDILHVDIWFHMSKEQVLSNKRPPCGFGTPECEYYDLDFFDSKLNFNFIKIDREKKLNDILKINI